MPAAVDVPPASSAATAANPAGRASLAQKPAPSAEALRGAGGQSKRRSLITDSAEPTAAESKRRLPKLEQADASKENEDNRTAARVDGAGKKAEKTAADVPRTVDSRLKAAAVKTVGGEAQGAVVSPVVVVTGMEASDVQRLAGQVAKMGGQVVVGQDDYDLPDNITHCAMLGAQTTYKVTPSCPLASRRPHHLRVAHPSLVLSAVQSLVSGLQGAWIVDAAWSLTCIPLPSPLASA